MPAVLHAACVDGGHELSRHQVSQREICVLAKLSVCLTIFEDLLKSVSDAAVNFISVAETFADVFRPQRPHQGVFIDSFVKKANLGPCGDAASLAPLSLKPPASLAPWA